MFEVPIADWAGGSSGKRSTFNVDELYSGMEQYTLRMLKKQYWEIRVRGWGRSFEGGTWEWEKMCLLKTSRWRRSKKSFPLLT